MVIAGHPTRVVCDFFLLSFGTIIMTNRKKTGKKLVG
jgi:hypothetical protein